MHEKSKTIIALLILIIVGFLVYKYYPVLSGHKYSSEKVTVADFDASKAPVGFPADFPLGDNPTEEKQLSYTDRDVVLYSISYDSPKQLEELFSLYKNYFTNQHYTLVSGIKNPSAYSLSALRGGDTYNVSIVPQNGFNRVEIAILHHL